MKKCKSSQKISKVCEVEKCNEKTDITVEIKTEPVESNQKIIKQEYEDEYWCNETNSIIRP